MKFRFNAVVVVIFRRINIFLLVTKSRERVFCVFSYYSVSVKVVRLRQLSTCSSVYLRNPYYSIRVSYSVHSNKANAAYFYVTYNVLSSK